MKKALLCVSFGTASEQARECITAVEDALQAAAPKLVFMRAFTSPTVRRLLAERGEVVYSPEEALTCLAGWGFREVVVQPTHVLSGREADNLAAQLIPWVNKFDSLRLGKPLLARTEDLLELARVLDREYPAREGEALVLFGHGSRQFSNTAYAAIQTAFRILGREDVLAGAVETWPGYEEIAAQLQRMGVERVRLVPMMLTCGRAAAAAIGERDSWRTRLEEAGLRVSVTDRGLGLLPGVQAMYCRHFSENL